MEDKTQYMDKADISRQLKNRSQTSGSILPRDIDLSIKNGFLNVFIKNPIQNRKVDSAAF